MSDIYCGIGKVPAGQKFGTMRECAEKRQVRRYGVIKIDPKTIDVSKRKDAIPESRDKLLLKAASLKGSIRRNKGRFEGAKDKDKKAEYEKLWSKAEKDLKIVSAKIQKIEVQREKEKTKTKTKTKATTKAKTATKAKTTSKTATKAKTRSTKA
jgi:hypothetical protein